MPAALTLDALNAAEPERFAALLDGVFEHSPWVAAGAAAARPFPTVAALHEALMRQVEQAPWRQRIAFLNAHPELSAGALPAGLTAESREEQKGAALAGAAGLEAMNAEYRERFGIPFIICVRRHTAANILRTLERRLGSTAEAEEQVALGEVAHITRLRLVQKVEGPGVPRTTGHLSTHVLDTSTGRPGAGLRVTLVQEHTPEGEWLTNADGRTDAPLLSGAPLRMGVHELRFGVGEYYAGLRLRSFHDVIMVRFVIDEAEGHYHVPLLLAPFSYTTYRGS